jgi:uncharacterized membrane protein YesL
MIFFCIKKWFFDLWDHLVYAGAFNLVSTALIAIPFVIIFSNLTTYPLVNLVITAAGFLPLGLYCAVVGRFARDFTSGNRFSLHLVPAYFKQTVLPGSRFTLVNVITFAFAFIALPFYAASDTPESIPLFAIVAAAVFFYAITIQYALPLHVLYEPKIGKTISKSFRFFMDNPGFTLGMTAGSLLIIAISIVTLTLFPGVMGLLLWHHVCFSMRMLKYEYLDTHPGASRKRIPWREILEEESNKIGKRTLRGLIFPWQE